LTREGDGEVKNLHDIEVMANEPTVVNSGESDHRHPPCVSGPVTFISCRLRTRCKLRYRVDGLLQENPPPPKHLHAALVSRIKSWRT